MNNPLPLYLLLTTLIDQKCFQLIWASATKLGIGLVKCQSYPCYCVVARYSGENGAHLLSTCYSRRNREYIRRLKQVGKITAEHL